MIEKLRLGILYKDGKMVNHRSLLTVLLNPVLRYFGIQIGTIAVDGELKGFDIMRYEKPSDYKIKWDFNNHNEYDKIVKKRILV